MPTTVIFRFDVSDKSPFLDQWNFKFQISNFTVKCLLATLDLQDKSCVMHSDFADSLTLLYRL